MATKKASTKKSNEEDLSSDQTQAQNPQAQPASQDPDVMVVPTEVATAEKEHLQWIYDRLVTGHNESPEAEYMVKLKEIIEGK